jgi:micrococcal nuclease
MNNQFSPKLKKAIFVLLFVLVFSSGWVVNGMFGGQKTEASPKPSASAEQNVESTEADKNREQANSENANESSSSVLPAETSVGGRQKVKVVRVVDGDTIEIEGGQKIRYIGVDTPETVKPNTAVQCFGKEASNKNKELVEGKVIEIEKDISETDKYDRLLRYVFVDDVFVNQYLVGEGYAYSSSYPPDVKYQGVFREAQKKAEEESKGLWGACPINEKKKVSTSTSAPSTVSKSTAVLGTSTSQTNSPTVKPAETAAVTTVSVQPTAANTTVSNGDCKIKGNISTSGKIYHLPGCGSYEKTGINLSQGEKWFCTEEEAVSAGWRKAKNC